MKPKQKYAVYLAAIAFLILFAGWIMPFWFGRLYGYSSKRQWGLFYTILCQLGNCTTVGGPIRTGSVDFLGSSTTMELFALPVLATMSFGLLLMSVMLSFIMYKKCCTCIRKFYLYMAIVTLLTATAIIIFITIVISGVATAQFFWFRPISSVIEIPWCVILYAVGEVFVIASDIFYFLFIRTYLKRKKRYRLSSEQHSSDAYSISLQYYPRRYNHPDYGICDNRHYNISTGYDIYYITDNSAGHFDYEPPPDYDLDTLKRKSGRPREHYKHKPGFKRIPRRYRHYKETDHQDIHSHYSQAIKPDTHYPHIAERDNTALEHTSSVWHENNAKYRPYRYYTGDSSAASYTSTNLDETVFSSVMTSVISDVSDSPHVFRRDPQEHLSDWQESRDYGSLAYAGKSFPEFSKFN